jgi:hypothetical protein
MRRFLKPLTLAGATAVLAIAAQATAAPTHVTHVYTVEPRTVPGVDTGLVLKSGRAVTATATGTVCPGSTPNCAGSDGLTSVDTTHSPYGSFLLPGAPAYGLVARIGQGNWVQVGSGPTQLSGSGDLVFAVNDDWYPDNTGSFRVTVSYSRGSASQVSAPKSCYPGNGYGDTHHEHSGPPGGDPGACWPGWGYGDKNHEHSGPPGQGSHEQSGSNTHGSSDDHGNSSSNDHGNSSANGH